MTTILASARAVVFDVDGTLVDTVDAHAESWRRAFAEFGRDFGFDELRAQIGKGGDQLLPVFLTREEIEDEGERIEARRSEIFKGEFLPGVRGFPEVRALFDLLIDRGVTVALGSSAKGEELEAYKRAAGVDGLDLVEASSDDAERSKPHPDIFHAALERLKTDPERTVVVGDTPYDAEAAGKAGLRAVGVLCGGFDENLLRKAGAIEIHADPAALLAALRRA